MIRGGKNEEVDDDEGQSNENEQNEEGGRNHVHVKKIYYGQKSSGVIRRKTRYDTRMMRKNLKSVGGSAFMVAQAAPFGNTRSTQRR